MGSEENRAVAPRGPAGLQEFIGAFTPQIKAALDGKLSSEKFIQVAVNSILGDEKLERSTSHSLMSSLLQAAEVQLFPGSTHGYAYLVPFKNKAGQYECQYILGYRGIIALCHRSPEILKVEAHTVHEGDEFEVSHGVDGGLRHKPKPWGTRDMKTLVGAYAIAYLKNGATVYELLNKAELEALRKRSKGRGFSPWDSDPLPMCRKSLVRKLARWLPLEPSDQAAITREETDDIVHSPESGVRYVSEENENVRNRLSAGTKDPELVREMEAALESGTVEPDRVEPEVVTSNDDGGWQADER